MAARKKKIESAAVEPELSPDLDGPVAEALSRAAAMLEHSAGDGGAALIRLHIAHSLSLALADSVAQTRRLQTLALAGQAAAQRRLLEGIDAEGAQLASELGHRAVEDATRETLSLAKAALQILSHADHPTAGPDA